MTRMPDVCHANAQAPEFATPRAESLRFPAIPASLPAPKPTRQPLPLPFSSTKIQFKTHIPSCRVRRKRQRLT